jgi:hypothetical protein
MMIHGGEDAGGKDSAEDSTEGKGDDEEDDDIVEPLELASSVCDG